jgi:hypothetical protein
MYLENKMFASSHLMPALYDYCRKGEHRPIKIGEGFVITTHRQTQDYLLCQECGGLAEQGREKIDR